MTAPSLSWMLRGACGGTDPEQFFPEWEAAARAAKAVCAGCPVRIPCLEFALRTGQESGVWGGLTEHERRSGGPRLCRNRLHPMDAANTWTDGNGHEKCRACRAASQRRFEAKRAVA